MDKIIWYTILGLVIALAAWGINSGFGYCTMGSGNVTIEDRTVAEFHSISLQGFGNVYVTQDNTSSLSLEAEDNVLEKLTTTVSNGVLSIRMVMPGCVRPTRPLNIYVSMSEVNSLAISGSGSITGETEISSDDLTASISGSGDIDLDVMATDVTASISGSGSISLDGTADLLTVVISGSGGVSALTLDANKTDISIYASGSANVHANEWLRGLIAGSGSINYNGSPTIDSMSISGSGNLNNLG
jgi:hypothetical protein